MSVRTALRSWLATDRTPPPRRPRRLAVEQLEDRTVPTTLSIGNATATEGSGALKFLDRFVTDGSGGLAAPARSAVLGPDGNGDGAQDLYVASGGSNAILRFDGVTGAPLDTFVPSGSGGLNSPLDLVFAPDGSLFVSSYGSNQVLRYNGSTGAFLGVVASGLSGPQGVTVGDDGGVYIANRLTNEVLRYNASGLSVFVAAGSGGLNLPRKVVFGPDANGDGIRDLYVASEGSNAVLRYNGQTGAFLNTAVTTSYAAGSGPMWLGLGADGNLITSGRESTTSLDMTYARYNATTGAFVDSFALGRDGWSFSVGPQNVLFVSSNGAGGAFVDRIGPSSLAAFTVSLDAASASPVTVQYATADGTAVAGSDYITTSGTITFAPGQTTRTVIVQTLDDALAEGTETFSLILSNPVGATITDGTGVGTITDDDATKYFVVNDGTSASSDQTYRYGTPGNGLTNTALASGNTAPRGAASTVAGDKVWVVDANKTVYVYSAAGALIGSWAAGGLPGDAQVEGLATNGTDIWLLDNRQDKVFKYTGAATRLTGNQSAASSFRLNGSNINGKGIVTDGTSLWVVDDGSSADKVFKYTLTGALLGSWTIDAANASPTGLTINPANVSDIWIVDNGTDRVYQYAAATGRTSGSQTASATFALAAGNSNPQDIADPPPAIALHTAFVGGPADPVRPAPASPPQGVAATRPPTPVEPPSRHKVRLKVSKPDTLVAGVAADFADPSAIAFHAVFVGGPAGPVRTAPASPSQGVAASRPSTPVVLPSRHTGQSTVSKPDTLAGVFVGGVAADFADPFDSVAGAKPFKGRGRF